MTLKSPQIMAEICDLHAGGLSFNNCCAKVGIANRTGHLWLKQSREDDPSTVIVYLDTEMQWWRALSISRQLRYFTMLETFEARMVSGDETPVFFAGRPQFQDDEAQVGLDEDLRELLYGHRDGLLRDAQGRRVPLVMRTPAPVAGVTRALAVAYPEWTEKSKVEQTVIQTQGVMTPRPVEGPPVLLERPPMPQLEALEPVVEPDLSDLLGPPPVEPDGSPEPTTSSDADEPEVETVDTVPNGTPDPGPRIAVPTPPAYAPTVSSRPISDRLAGLLRR